MQHYFFRATPRVLGALAALIVIVAALYPARAIAEVDPEVSRELVHSDLPLFGDEIENKWPRSFYSQDEFGCTSRVSFGDWRYRENGDETGSYSEWFRIWNYGVFHCWAGVSESSQQEDLEYAEEHPSFFVLLGTARANNRDVELWALQMGARPGSEYLLLSRAPEAGLIEAFNLLQTKCPIGATRRGANLSILMTRYCSINTKGEFLRFAIRMAHLPPRGTLTLAPPQPGQ